MKNKFLGLIVKILIILGIIVIAVFAWVLSSKAKQEHETHKEKIEKEIDYLDTQITALANKLNGIELENYKVSISKIREENAKEKSGANSSDEKNGEKSETKGEESSTSEEETKLTKMEKETTDEGNEEIDWEWIKGKTEMIYSAWATIVLDLYDIDIESAKILEFSELLDKAVVDIKNKDKKSACQTYANLYSLIVEFTKNTEIGKEKKSAIEIKNNIIKAYANVTSEDWDKVQEEVQKAEETATNLINEVNKEENAKRYNVNKIYILVEELKNSLVTKENQIFYIKYKNLIEEINTII